MSDDRLIVALDVPHAVAGLELTQKLGDAVSFYKIGLGMLTGGGLARRAFHADDDIPEQFPAMPGALPFEERKRQHIGGALLPAPIPIEPPNRGIVHQGDRKLRRPMPDLG